MQFLPTEPDSRNISSCEAETDSDSISITPTNRLKSFLSLKKFALSIPGSTTPSPSLSPVSSFCDPNLCLSPGSSVSALSSVSNSVHPGEVHPDNLEIRHTPDLSFYIHRVKRKKVLGPEKRPDCTRLYEELEAFYTSANPLELPDRYIMANYKTLKTRYFYFLFVKRRSDPFEVFQHPPLLPAGSVSAATSMLIVNLSGEELAYHKRTADPDARLRRARWKRPVGNGDFYVRVQSLAYLSLSIPQSLKEDTGEIDPDDSTIESSLSLAWPEDSVSLAKEGSLSQGQESEDLPPSTSLSDAAPTSLSQPQVSFDSICSFLQSSPLSAEEAERLLALIVQNRQSQR